MKLLAETISKPLITYYLEAGQYQLTVTALDENNQVLGTTEYYFSVRPPLYLSKVAYLVYLLIICFAGFFAWKGIKNHVTKAKRGHPAGTDQASAGKAGTEGTEDHRVEK